MNTRPRRIYEFGPYRLELAECRLWRGGQELKLRPRLFDLLAVLAQRGGQMIEKDELLQTVWPDSAVEENNLTVSINALRKILGEHYIETVSKRGYRFTAPVTVLAGETPNAAPPLAQTAAPGLPTAELPPPGGALPLHSPLYLARRTDAEFNTAIARRDSIVLVKGARQVGKTSLLARGLQEARAAGAAVVLTDFQHLNAEAFATVEKLLLTLAELIADRLDLDTPPHEHWNSFLSPSSNFERYLRRQVLARLTTPLVWALDEVDRLFSFAYASEIFGLFRSWHNLRALEPDGPWPRLTLALAYATEAHLFISDLNQSPFNVGTRLVLEDFTCDQIAELNERYGAPLGDEAEIARFFALLGGHPYLAQRGLYELAQHGLALTALEAQADHDEGLFGDHLRRLLVSLERDAALCAALRAWWREQTPLANAEFYRLRSAGVLAGEAATEARPRCELYARYLQPRLL
ncbi:MAG: helix-turn-helix transcriptional regulator [Acidobacteria bacterium]|nr:helix-turn-helix transcriptional regulator [Acidobacteriota bacterium]